MINDAKFEHAIIKLRCSLYNEQLISTRAFHRATFCGMPMCQALC